LTSSNAGGFDTCFYGCGGKTVEVELKDKRWTPIKKQDIET
jgi:hypothetical protein